MRGLIVAVVVGCGGAPDVPARLEEIADLPQLFQDTPAAFDANDKLVLMDQSSGLRRLEGDRLVMVSGTAAFSFGTIGLDLDGMLLLGSFNTAQLARLEADDTVVLLPSPPLTFTRVFGAPSGSYYILPAGGAGTMMMVLPPGGATWLESPLQLDRTLRAPDGEIYAIFDGDVARLAADDSPMPIASCAEFAGGICLDLELAGTDADGHIHMSIRGTPSVHILDPVSATYRQVALPGMLEVEQMAAGAAMSVVMASDPERQNQLSLWLLLPGSDQLLRFATLPFPLGSGQFSTLVADRAGNVYLIADGKLQAVVPN